MTDDQTVPPLSPTQRDMANLIVAGRVRFHAPSATFYDERGEKITRSRGRTLREMGRADLTALSASPDAQGRVLVVLTARGDARLQVI